MDACFAVICIAVIGIAVGVTVRMQRRAEAAFQGASRSLGLRYSPGGWMGGRRLEGEVKGYPVTVDTFTRGSGKTRHTYTRFRLRLPRPLGLGLSLTKEGFLSGVAKAFGSQDIQVGDAAFDAGVLVKGREAGRVRDFLTPARRMCVRHFLWAQGGGRVDDDEVYVETWGQVTDMGVIQTTVHLMARVARVLEGGGEEGEDLNRAVAARREGRIDDALRIVVRRVHPPPRKAARPAGKAARPAGKATATPPPDDPASGPPDEPAPGPPDEPAPPPSPEATLMEGEMLHLAGRLEEARRVFERARAESPGDPEVVGWVEALGHPGGEAPAPAPPTEAVVPAGAAEGAASVCVALFGGTSSGVEATRRFEGGYRGRAVRWEGTLVRVEDFSYDAVLGPGPGRRAVFEVAEVDAGLLGLRRVQALVRLLPEEDADRLRARVGARVAFEGSLLRCDGFLRNLYLTGGRTGGGEASPT
ncbi:MAG: tetratricopeptide repeat protein [Planctomycetes bacterium]|nr:tetratricopeptide repeat protein [Planctomycetota bacterium]